MKRKNATFPFIELHCLLILILILFTAQNFLGFQEEQGKVKGTIYDSEKKPLKDVILTLKHLDTGQPFTSKSNKKGSFSFNFLPAGKFSFTAEKEGYQGFSGEFELKPNTVQELEITLVKALSLEQKAEKEAIEAFQEGVKLVQENKITEAIEAFKKATELKPDFSEAFTNLGILLFQAKRDEEAEQALLKSRELKPNDPKPNQILTEIYYEKARVLVQSDKIDEGLEILKKAYELNPNHAYVNYLMGIIYATKQMKEEAIKHLENFLKLEPNSPFAEKAKEVLESLKE